VVIPAHQFPLGMTLAPQRRAAFTGWAAQAGGVLIEDDYGVAVDGLAGYATAAHTAGPALVVGYSRPAAHAYTTAITRLCAALAEARRQTRVPEPGRPGRGATPALK
jgi:hypothetical protein